MASLRRGGGVLPPVLAALYFVLHLAAASWTESRLLSDLRWPVAASLGVALVAWLAAKWLLRDGAKATVLATIVVVGFGAFGYVVQGIARLWHTDPYLVSPWAFLLLDAGLVAAALRLRRSRHQYDQAARFVLLMMGLLAAFAAGRTLLRSVPRVAAPAEVASKPARRAASTARPPDIYLILIDKYTGSRVLRTTYGLDNSGFVDTLRQLGFYVPSAPRANYVHTFLALASILNARYLDELPAQVGVDELSRRPADPLIEHNLLMTELRQRGYRVIFFPTSYPATRRSPLADAQIPSPDRVQPEFVSQWLWTTP
ncbi:MAG TPA: hypothetical protein VFT84_12345, partial [Gemmatimonadales bacterium]|nr:hypothetical protein [Gemmatimonadales bacterium]